jgi:hypothetical protein
MKNIVLKTYLTCLALSVAGLANAQAAVNAIAILDYYRNVI